MPAQGSVATSSSNTQIQASDTVQAFSLDYDLVLVVAGAHSFQFNDKKVLNWLQQLARRGVLLGGVSGGPVVLANAALMHNRRMTVHWDHIEALEAQYPQLMIEKSLYVMDRDRISCAGGIAPLDMMHALISKHHGAQFARKISDWLIHTEIRPSSAAQRSGLVERYKVNQVSVLDAIEAMENHIADPLDLAQLSQLTGLSSRQLNRLFNDNLGSSTMTFYRLLRLEKGQKLLQQSALSITDIALLTGFSSAAHFASCYAKHFQITPRQHRCM